MKIKKLFITGCTPCMAVTDVMKNMDLSKIDIEEIDMSNGKTQKEMIEKYDLNNVPTLIIYNDNGKEEGRLEGYISREEIESFIN